MSENWNSVSGGGDVSLVNPGVKMEMEVPGTFGRMVCQHRV